MAGVPPLNYPRCTDWLITFQLFSDLAMTMPVDLTGYGALWILAASELSAPIIQGSTHTGEIVITGMTGLITISIPKTETDIASGQYYHFLKLEAPITLLETQPIDGQFFVTYGRVEQVAM